MAFPLIATIAAPMVAGAIQAGIAKNKANKLQSDINTKQGVVDDLLTNRQDVYNAADDFRAMKDMVENPYANLGVATQAAEIQMQETDQALANTLDTLMATGTGAGGATALARAAAKSKQGISADIEKQEAANEKLRAEGEQQMRSQLMDIEARAIGAEQAAFAIQEQREQAGIDRAYGELDFYMSRQLGLEDAATAAIMQGISGTTSAITSGMGEGGAISEYVKAKAAKGK